MGTLFSKHNATKISNNDSNVQSNNCTMTTITAVSNDSENPNILQSHSNQSNADKSLSSFSSHGQNKQQTLLIESRQQNPSSVSPTKYKQYSMDNNSTKIHHDPSFSNNYCNYSGYWQCEICDRICCKKCFLVQIFSRSADCWRSQCKECYASSTYNQLYDITQLFYESIFHSKRNIEINIISLITDYSFQQYVECRNETNGCFNKITLNVSKYNLNKSEHININNLITMKQQLVGCHDCYRKKEMHVISTLSCNVFHNIQYSKACDNGFCGGHICTKCVNKLRCDGIDCNGRYCQLCLREMRRTNQCRHCRNKWNRGVLCDKCMYNSVCKDCGIQLCKKCQVTSESGDGFCAPCYGKISHKETMRKLKDIWNNDPLLTGNQ